MLDQNRADYSRDRLRGVPREGAALSQGLVYCGECGHQLGAQYKKRSHYRCLALRNRYGGPVCQHIPTEPIDRAIVAAFFAALAPAELEVYEQAVEQERSALAAATRAHQQQLERLRYEAALAERQFRRVDPDNRLVAGELEGRWEKALRELKQAEEAFAQQPAAASAVVTLDAEIRSALTALGQQLPGIWGGVSSCRAHRRRRYCVA